MQLHNDHPRPILRLVLGLVAANLLAGCTGLPAPCASSSACKTDQTCRQGRCREASAVPTRASDLRVVLEPKALAFLTERPGDPRVVATLGRESDGHTALLLDFDVPHRPDLRVQSAFLVMEPEPGIAPSEAPLSLDVCAIKAPWNATLTAWAHLPKLSRVCASGARVSSWGGQALRIDITPLVRDLASRGSTEYGIALLGTPEHPQGTSYSLGMTGGNPPHLDLHLRPTP